MPKNSLQPPQRSQDITTWREQRAAPVHGRSGALQRRRMVPVPTRADLARQQRRLTDAQGRIYYLPLPSDPMYADIVSRGEVRESNDWTTFERELSRGLEFNPTDPALKLGENLMLYVQCNKKTRLVDRHGQRLDPLPAPRGTPGDTGQPLILNDAKTGHTYQAKVDAAYRDGRSKRGIVRLTNVKLVMK